MALPTCSGADAGSSRSLAAAAALLGAAASSRPAPWASSARTGRRSTCARRPGYVHTPDGNTIYMWSYRAGGTSSRPGRRSASPRADRSRSSCTTTASRAHIDRLPRPADVTTSGGTRRPAARGALRPGGTVTYAFTAGEPGTYLYESGTDQHKQIEMGLFGALVVRPAGHPDQAYARLARAVRPGREYLLLLHDSRPRPARGRRARRALRHHRAHARYFTINGRDLPDTLAPNDAAVAAGAAVRRAGADPAATSTNPLPALDPLCSTRGCQPPVPPAREPPARDRPRRAAAEGATGEDGSFEDFTRTIASGQTYDVAALDATRSSGGRRAAGLTRTRCRSRSRATATWPSRTA